MAVRGRLNDDAKPELSLAPFVAAGKAETFPTYPPGLEVSTLGTLDVYPSIKSGVERASRFHATKYSPAERRTSTHFSRFGNYIALLTDG